MSAYALPGFFPPIVYPSSSESEGCGSSSTNGQASRTGPLHEEGGSTLSNIFKASVDRFCPPLLNSSTEDAVKKTSNEEKPGIQVKEAKIDPVRLVQWLTQSPRTQTQTSKKSHLRRRTSRERLSDAPPKSPSNRKDDKTTCVGSHHDEPIEFELSISLNGRKYTATRTMQCIVQLRDDLISEMNNRKQWLQIRRSNGSSSSSENQFSTSEVEDISVQIPEIPSMSGDDNGPTVGAGFVGRGFTMLHAMVTSYVPAMERWLRNIMVVVPQDSECLMNFLWEPLPNDIPLDFGSKSCSSMATLGSIKELEYNTDHSDSEDEWEG